MARAECGLEMEHAFLQDEEEDGERTPNGSRYNFKPSSTFEVEANDIESGGSKPQKQRGQYRRWFAMGARERKTYSPEGRRDFGDEADGLLNGDTTVYLRGPKKRRSRTWYEHCICGGNMGLSLCAFLLVLNLIFGSTTYFRFKRPDPFKDWGKPGTGSEGLSWYPTDFLRDVSPVPCHSHNDYWREVPLFSALYVGCISVEADVWSHGDDLLVGHNMASLTKNRTFQSLYINPLVKLLERQNPKTEFYNGTMHGVFDTDPTQSITLLVDVKTDGKLTWPAVVKQLEPLRQRDWLTFVKNGTINSRPVTIVGTGETPYDVLTSNETYRDYFFDAPLDQMWESQAQERIPEESIPMAPATIHKRGQGNSGTSPDDDYTNKTSWYASTEFNTVIGRIWWRDLTDKQLDLIRGHVRGAHRRGLKVRYWGTPSWPISVRNHVWEILVREGADVINADDLGGVSKGVW